VSLNSLSGNKSGCKADFFLLLQSKHIKSNLKKMDEEQTEIYNIVKFLYGVPLRKKGYYSLLDYTHCQSPIHLNLQPHLHM